MADHDVIYKESANVYDAMISRQPDLSEIIKEIRPYRNLDVVDLGAGSGRISSFVAPEAKSLICTDLSRAMLDQLDFKLSQRNMPRNWTTVEADHRELPIPDSSIDMVISGWSICYLASSNQPDWETNLEDVMTEIRRILKPQGTAVILETMGTGTETPNPPDFLMKYYSQLEEKYQFEHRWIRMDYAFESVEEAIENTEFFFGHELASKIRLNQWSTVPECAGIWWKHFE
ncbi:class I SAM-dependent methyltransferase [Cohnella caldifontis]|uniref:class I SAM-dependent methyltransferase n=1 Tax=Cohnella caldifontis TaxID=3027471 RepID=UPI0023ED98D9|nr:class I SAM-dependent methyltransferase [Cohnella sp. YIM B05605]